MLLCSVLRLMSKLALSCSFLQQASSGSYCDQASIHSDKYTIEEVAFSFNYLSILLPSKIAFCSGLKLIIIKTAGMATPLAVAPAANLLVYIQVHVAEGYLSFITFKVKDLINWGPEGFFCLRLGTVCTISSIQEGSSMAVICLFLLIQCITLHSMFKVLCSSFILL